MTVDSKIKTRLTKELVQSLQERKKMPGSNAGMNVLIVHKMIDDWVDMEARIRELESQIR